ncbi:hypothetical protein DOE78_23225 [Bacillus sp. Y1]|nr:hypothetical protein [Bacillus sp. Y1]AYA78077.1 hypothetical protein DOE78_23225 [Bacillus sp. Y1]
MNYIVSWFYLEEKGNESSYMQVNAKSTSKKFQDTYWKCIISFYYSSIQQNKNAKHIFYTNSTHLPKVDGVNVYEFFKKNDIEVRNQELTNKTPLDWHNAWRNQFYIFDILNDLNELVRFNDSVIILDSDCIINNNLDKLFEEIRNKGLVSYLIGYEKNHVINGISTIQMVELYNQFYSQIENVQYYGGEFIGIKGEQICKVLKEYRYLWELNYKNYEINKMKLNEEAHFLSVIYHKLNLANTLGNHYIKRIWNGLNFHNLEESDNLLDIFHLPAQKTTGFSYFFDKIVKKNKSYSLEDVVRIFDINLKKSKKRIAQEILTKVLFKYKN